MALIGFPGFCRSTPISGRLAASPQTVEAGQLRPASRENICTQFPQLQTKGSGIDQSLNIIRVTTVTRYVDAYCRQQCPV